VKEEIKTRCQRILLTEYAKTLHWGLKHMEETETNAYVKNQ
jgi:hypothetical protein